MILHVEKGTVLFLRKRKIQYDFHLSLYLLTILNLIFLAIFQQHTDLTLYSGSPTLAKTCPSEQVSFDLLVNLE